MVHNLRIQIWSHSWISITFNNHLKSQQIPIMLCRSWPLSKSKRPFEKQTTPRLVNYLCLSMDKIWAKMIVWLWPRNFDVARFLQTFALKNDVLLHFLFLKSFQSDFYREGNEWNGIGSSHPMAVQSPRQVASVEVGIGSECCRVFLVIGRIDLKCN